jgi:hypothetical protein
MYDVPAASADDGVNVRLVLVPVTVPGTAPDGPVNVSVPLPDAIGTLKVTVNELLTGTDVAPLPGEALTTVGGPDSNTGST